MGLLGLDSVTDTLLLGTSLAFTLPEKKVARRVAASKEEANKANSFLLDLSVLYGI